LSITYIHVYSKLTKQTHSEKTDLQNTTLNRVVTKIILFAKYKQLAVFKSWSLEFEVIIFSLSIWSSMLIGTAS